MKMDRSEEGEMWRFSEDEYVIFGSNMPLGERKWKCASFNFVSV